MEEHGLTPLQRRMLRRRQRTDFRRKLKGKLSDADIRYAKPDELIEMFKPQAEAYAVRRYQRNPDAIQDAYLALVIAAYKYDGQKGAFYSYLNFWLKQTVGRGASRRDKIIRLPERAKSSLGLIMEAREFLGKKGIKITDESIAEYTGLSVERVATLRKYPTAFLAGLETERPDSETQSTFLRDVSDEDWDREHRSVEAWADIETYLAEHEELLEIATEWVNNPGTKTDLRRMSSQIRRGVRTNDETDSEDEIA